MEAYTFRTVLENGVVALPKVYENKLIEVTVREVKGQNIRKRELLSSVEIDTAGVMWTREDANERR
jgi:hypothetical protein